MRKKILLLLIFLLLLPGCHKEEDDMNFDIYKADSGTTQTDLQNMQIEQYVEEGTEPESPYLYMKKVRLKEQEYFIDTYIIDADNLIAGDASASSSRDGINMSVKAMDIKNDTAYIQSHISKRVEKIKQNELLKGEPTSSVNGNVGTIRYSFVKDNKEYPCIEIYKVDHVGGEEKAVSLFVSVAVDNMKTTDKSSEIFSEVKQVVGIEIG